MFPYPDNLPSGRRKGFVDHSISVDVAVKLLRPVLAIRARPHAVLFAAVPEAAVDEDGYSLPGKKHVWAND